MLFNSLMAVTLACLALAVALGLLGLRGADLCVACASLASLIPLLLVGISLHWDVSPIQQATTEQDSSTQTIHLVNHSAHTLRLTVRLPDDSEMPTMVEIDDVPQEDRQPTSSPEQALLQDARHLMARCCALDINASLILFKGGEPLHYEETREERGKVKTSLVSYLVPDDQSPCQAANDMDAARAEDWKGQND